MCRAEATEDLADLKFLLLRMAYDIMAAEDDHKPYSGDDRPTDRRTPHVSPADRVR
jgi:hypothetical protein